MSDQHFNQITDNINSLQERNKPTLPSPRAYFRHLVMKPEPELFEQRERYTHIEPENKPCILSKPNINQKVRAPAQSMMKIKALVKPSDHLRRDGLKPKPDPYTMNVSCEGNLDQMTKSRSQKSVSGSATNTIDQPRASEAPQISACSPRNPNKPGSSQKWIKAGQDTASLLEAIRRNKLAL